MYLKKANIGCLFPLQYKISIQKGKSVLAPRTRIVLSTHVLQRRFKSQIIYLQYITMFPRSENNHSNAGVK